MGWGQIYHGSCFCWSMGRGLPSKPDRRTFLGSFLLAWFASRAVHRLINQSIHSWLCRPHLPWFVLLVRHRVGSRFDSNPFRIRSWRLIWLGSRQFLAWFVSFISVKSDETRNWIFCILNIKEACHWGCYKILIKLRSARMKATTMQVCDRMMKITERWVFEDFSFSCLTF